mgnify:CR=1 FL=1
MLARHLSPNSPTTPAVAQAESPVLEFPLLFVFPAAMAFAGAMDLLTMTIPNRVSLVLVAAFAALAPVSGLPLQAILGHMAAGALVLLIGFAMFTQGWLGGGDAKLLAATALWLGFDNLIPYLLWTSILGGALALAIIGYRSLVPPIWALGQDWAMRLYDRKAGIPYGMALAGAALLIYPSTKWFAVLAA